MDIGVDIVDPGSNSWGLSDISAPDLGGRHTPFSGEGMDKYFLLY